MMHCGVFLMNFKVLRNVVKRCLECLIYLLKWKLILKIKLSNKIIKVRDFLLSQGIFTNLKQSKDNLVTTPLSKYH